MSDRMARLGGAWPQEIWMIEQITCDPALDGRPRSVVLAERGFFLTEQAAQQVIDGLDAALMAEYEVSGPVSTFGHYLNLRITREGYLRHRPVQVEGGR